MGASHSNYDTHSSLKKLNTPIIEDKLVEFLNSIGFVSSINTENFDSYVTQIKSELSNSDLNDNSIQTAISGIRTYLEDGLSIKTDESPSNTLKNGYDIVKTVNDTVKMHLSHDLDNIKSVIADSDLLSSLLSDNKYGGNDKLTENLYNKTVDMVKNNAMILNQLYNSEIINDLKSNVNNKDTKYNDNDDIKTSTLNYINEIVNTLSNVHNYNEVSKVYNNDSIKLNKEAFDSFKSYYGSMSNNKNISDDQVKDLLDKLYKSINEPKKTGGGSNFLESIRNEFNSSVNWDSYSTVKDILSQKSSQQYLYTGSSDTFKETAPKIEYEINGSGELQNKLKYTITMKNAKRNAEMISNADILNDKLSSISSDLISQMPSFKSLTDTQIDDLEKIFKKFLYFASFKYKNMFLILLGFYVDLQSIYIKKDFIVKVTNIIELCQKGSVILPKLKSISEKLTDILTFVSKTSDEYSNKYWLGKETSDRSITDAYDTRIMIDYDDIPQLNLMNSVISNTVFRIIYSLRLTSYHNQLKTSADHKNKDYEELVGKSLGYEIDKIKEDYTKIMTKLNELEQIGVSAEFKDDKSIELNYPISVIPVPTPSSTGEVTYTYSEIKRIFMYLPCEPPVDEKTSNNRDHRAWGRNDPDWIDDEFLRGVKPHIEPIRGEKFKSMINNYKQYFINYYESVIGLHMVAQVIDIYLMKFTEKIRKTPDIIEKLDTLLSNSKISSLVHTDKVADYLVDIFDPSHCNKTNNNSSNKNIIDNWVKGQIKTHKSFTYKKENKFLSPLMFNHYFISSEENDIDIAIGNDECKKITDAGNLPISEIAKFDRESSIINCGAGACDEVRPMVDLIANRIPDNSINRGGLHNSRWSTLPGSLDRLKKVIDYANINDMNLINENDINKNINLTEWENSSHSMGSEYYEKYIIDDSNTRTPIDKLRKLKEYHKNNSTLTNLISLFFSMVQVEDDGNKTLSPKTILDYLLNFMCWGSYTITNTPSTLDINIGNDMPISNDVSERLTNIDVKNINFDNDTNKNIGKSIYEYFTLVNDNNNYDKMYDYMFSYDGNMDYSDLVKNNCGDLLHPTYGSNIYTVKNYLVGNYKHSFPEGRGQINEDNKLPHYFTPNKFIDDNVTSEYQNINDIYIIPLFLLKNNTQVPKNKTTDPFIEKYKDHYTRYNGVNNNTSNDSFICPKIIDMGNDSKPLFYSSNFLNHITLNKITKTISTLKIGTPVGLINRIKSKEIFSRLNEKMFLSYNGNYIINCDNPLLVGVNDNLSVFNKNYTSMNIFDTNVRVTLIHSNQLCDTEGSNYINTIQYKSQILFSNIIKSIIGKILTVIGIYDINDYKKNKPWRTYIMDTTRITIGGSDHINDVVVRTNIVEYYIRIPLLLKFYKYIFYDISQDDSNVKSKFNVDSSAGNQSVKLLPEFDYPFDTLIKHYFIYYTEGYDNNIMFNKTVYENINLIYDYFSKKNNGSDLIKVITRELVKEINQKYGILFHNDLKMYKARISKLFGIDQDFVTNFDIGESLYDNENILSNDGDTHSNIPSQKYTKFKDSYKNDVSNSLSGFSAKTNYENMSNFRRFIQTVLTESINDSSFSSRYNTYSSFFNIEEYLKDIKNELNNGKMNEEEKILHLSTIIQKNSSNISNIDNNKKAIIYEFIVTPLKQIDNIMNYLSHLRAAFSNEEIKKTSYSVNSNKIVHSKDWVFSRSNLLLPSNSNLLYSAESYTWSLNIDNVNSRDPTTYAKCALYGFIPTFNESEKNVSNLLRNYVPFNEIMVPSPLTFDKLFLENFNPYYKISNKSSDAHINDKNNAELNLMAFSYSTYTVLDIETGKYVNIVIDPSNYFLSKIENTNYNTNDTFLNRFYRDNNKFNHNIKNLPIPYDVGFMHNDSKNILYSLNNSMHTQTYNKNSEIINNVKSGNFVYIDSQYHNSNSDVYTHNLISQNVYNNKYGLLGINAADKFYVPRIRIIDDNSIIRGAVDKEYTKINADDFSEINIGNNNTAWIKGRKASHGILLGDDGVYTKNCLQRFPIPWNEIRTTNFRLMASWTPEDLAPCRLGLHEQPYIKQGKLQNRGYSSTYHIIEYLLTKLFKDCNLFDINTSSSIGSHNQNNSNVFITFNKIDEYIKKQIINCTKFINEIKMTTNSPIIDSCEYYLRTIHSQYNSLFIPGVKDYNEQVGKTTMYDIQSLLNNFLMGTISEKDINHSANGKLLSGIDESSLYIDPCITKSPHESSDSILSSYKNNNAQIVISINKMGARLLTKLVNPLLFSLKQAESFVHKPERLAYLPHQRITGPLNVVDDSHYGKINIEAYSEFSSASTSSIKSSDLLHTEPNLKYCNFYFTNVINEINKIVRILISSATSNRDKKTYSKIIDMFKSQSDLLSNTIDNRFESINTINYLGDYGRTGHGTFFDRSLPFVLYNDVNNDIKTYIDSISNNGNINYYTKCDFDKDITGDSVLDSKLDYFHKYTLSSIDGVSYDKYSSSYISLPTHLGDVLDFNSDSKSDYGKLFKDTHENLYPSSFYYSEPKKATDNLYHFRTSLHKKKEVAYGILNPSDDLNPDKKTMNWYDIIGKRGLNQPLVNICNIYDKNKVSLLNNAQKGYRMIPGMVDNNEMKPPNNPFLTTSSYYDDPSFDGTTYLTNANTLKTTMDHFSDILNINLLNKSRYVFSYIYSYGSLHQSNFMYDDISKFKLKPILVKAYKSQAYAFDSYDNNDTVNNIKGSINEIAGKWETNVNDVNGLFNKLVPLNNVDAIQENNYMISIVSELLHGNFSPVIISKTEKNAPHDMKKFIKNRNKLLSEEVDKDYLINRGRYDNGEFKPKLKGVNILTDSSNNNYTHSKKIRGQPENFITFGNVASILKAVYRNNRNFYNRNENFKNENFDINNYKLLLNNDINSIPNKLKLTYIQYNDDHLRLGQSIATYNPTISQWDTFQPIQCNENDEIYTSNNNVTADMFTKVSYSRLLADLTSIDSYEQLKFLSSESTLYSLGLSSSYSTPNNEHFGSPLFEYRPTYMYEKSPNKKLYSRLDFSLEPLVISVEKSKYAATNPYDSCLSLEMGGTGFWQLSGHNPIVNDSYDKVIAKYRLNVNDIYDYSMGTGTVANAERSILNNKSYPTEILLKSNSFNFTHMGIQNGVLQDIDNADFSRYGSIIINANNSITGISSYPDAYVDINKYKQNSSVLNPVENGLKKMANEINKSVFNKAYLGHIHNHDEKYKTIYNNNNLKEGKVLPSTLIKTALNTITTCDRRMGPHNTLTKIGEHKKPLYNTYISPDNLFKGGADALSTSTTIHNMLNSLSSNILAIALNTDNEPLAVSLQNTKEIEQGNVLFKSYSSIIKNIIKNVNSQTSDPRNVFMNLGDSSEEVKESLSATIPYLISELENLFSQIKFLYHYSSKNSSLGGIRSIIEINLQQTKRIATVIYNGLQSIKQELKSDFVLGEQFKGQIGDNNVSFSCELYNYLSNCNEMIIRPNGTINEYFSLNNIVKNQGASFFNRLHAIRKLYDKNSLIKIEEFPTANKLLKKLNLSLDKNNNQINKSLIEDIINTCKMLKMTPFEETHVNNFVCFVNNCHSYIKNRTNNYYDKEKVSGGVNAHSTMSNGPRNLNINNEINDTLKSHFKLYAKNTGINSLLFLPNNSPSDNNLTINDILGNVGFNNDVEYFSKINDIISGFNQNIRLNNNTMKTNNIDVESSKNNIYGNDDKQLMIYNILDLNILPIDINSLTKEIPLFYIFNYSASVDEYFTSALEAFSIDMYINSIVKNNFEKYVDNFRGFISKICSGEYNNIDLHKIINNNKYTYVNPQLSDSSSQWNIEDYNSFKAFNSINSNFNSLNKFNSIINIVNNCYVSGTGHRHGMVESLLDSSKPYPYDYEHPSTKQRYQGVSTNPLANITSYNKNLSYNNFIINNKIKISGNLYDDLENVSSLNNNSVNNQVNLKISTLLDVYYFGDLISDNIQKTKSSKIKISRDNFNFDSSFMKDILVKKDFDLSKNNILNTPQLFSLSDEYFYDITSLRCLSNFKEYETNAEKNNLYLASTGLYTSRKHLVGYNTNYSDNVVTKKNNINKPLEYLNCYVNECYLSGIYNLSHYSNENKDKSFKYTSTLPFNANNTINKNNTQLNNASFKDKNNWMYEITPPDFLVNINNNWNKEINNIDVPNPCCYNSIIMKTEGTDNMDVYKELPTSSYYNLSCVISDLDNNYITPITKLNKFENPSFIKNVLNDKIGSNETSINKAIEYKCLSSWGIIDPRAINYNGTQKNIHKAVAFINDDKSKVYYDKKIIQLTISEDYNNTIFNYYKTNLFNDEYFAYDNTNSILSNSTTKAPKSDMLKRNEPIGRGRGENPSTYPNTGIFERFEVIMTASDPDTSNGDILDTVKKSINFTSCMLTNRIPINLNEYKELPFDYKMSSQYLFLRKENCLASNWNSFTRSPKYHTSSSYNKVKSRCGFNHTLPVVDVKGMPIFSSDIGVSGSLDYNVFRNVSNIIFINDYINNNENIYDHYLKMIDDIFNNLNNDPMGIDLRGQGHAVYDHVNFLNNEPVQESNYNNVINKIELSRRQRTERPVDTRTYYVGDGNKYNSNYGAEFINNLKVVRNNYSNYPSGIDSSMVPEKFKIDISPDMYTINKGEQDKSNRILYNTKLNNGNGGEYQNFSNFIKNPIYNSDTIIDTLLEHSKKNIMMKEIDGAVLTPVYKYPYENAKLADEGNINEKDTLFYPKSVSIAAKLIKEETSNLSMLDYKTAGFAATNGITSADVLASGGNPNDSRSIHVLSHILYNVNTGGYVPLRHLSLIDIGYNFIRYKITKEHAFTTSKIISGSMLYDTEYHRNDFTGVNERPDSMTNVSGLYRPIHPRIRIKK